MVTGIGISSPMSNLTICPFNGVTGRFTSIAPGELRNTSGHHGPAANTTRRVLSLSSPTMTPETLLFSISILLTSPVKTSARPEDTAACTSDFVTPSGATSSCPPMYNPPITSSEILASMWLSAPYSNQRKSERPLMLADAARNPDIPTCLRCAASRAFWASRTPALITLW